MNKLLHVLIVREQIAAFLFASPGHFAEENFVNGSKMCKLQTCAPQKEQQSQRFALQAKF